MSLPATNSTPLQSAVALPNMLRSFAAKALSVSTPTCMSYLELYIYRSWIYSITLFDLLRLTGTDPIGKKLSAMSFNAAEAALAAAVGAQPGGLYHSKVHVSSPC